MSTAVVKRPSHSEYWDERYAKVGADEQVHQWFQSFKDLVPSFNQRLFKVRTSETNPRILPLESGDSVSLLGRSG